MSAAREMARRREQLSELRAGATEIARLLKILSHPNRLLIACDLMEGERSVSAIEARTGVKQPVLSRDLGRLRTAGLVLTRRRSKQIFYRLADKRLANVIEGLCISCAVGAPSGGRRRSAAESNGAACPVPARRSPSSGPARRKS
jgi:DNA-binding transcriptional ArsR family regulator